MKKLLKISLLTFTVSFLVACGSPKITHPCPKACQSTEASSMKSSKKNKIIVNKEHKEQVKTKSDPPPDPPPHHKLVEHIALLLPLTGKLSESGKAVKAGFYDAYHETPQTSRPIISTFDTHSDTQVTQAYDQAVAHGANIVIGPLSQEGLDHLKSKKELSVPVLALNYNQKYSKQLSPHFYQFGLAPEDEIKQAAQQAKEEGYTSALLIAPDTPWGKQMAKTFKQEWYSHGKLMIDTVYFNDNQDVGNVIRKALHIKETQTPKSKPKPRDDIDVIFLAASSDEAHQIKPMFSFYYSGHLPVYSTSSIYTGIDDNKKDNDLNGIIFCDAPFVLDHEENIQKSVKKLNKNHKRFYALGYDAYDVINYLPVLKNNKDYLFQGKTGYLSVNKDLHIERHLPCAQFKKGHPKIISDKLKQN